MFVYFSVKFSHFFLQISFFSTSPELSNKQRFEYFSRTIPSDHYQTMAMAKIVERLGWKYMSIIYEESNYGIKASNQKKKKNTTYFRHWVFRDFKIHALFRIPIVSCLQKGSMHFKFMIYLLYRVTQIKMCISDSMLVKPSCV